MKRVACLILAAGEAKRFGFPKQILPWGETTILGTVVTEALKSKFTDVFTVIGAHYEKVLDILSPFGSKLKIILNEEWKRGMFSSIEKGLSSIYDSSNYDYTLIQLGDMPFITSEIFNIFIDLSENSSDFIIAEESGRPAHPYMFKTTIIPDILNGDHKNGMRDIIISKFDTATKINLQKSCSRQDIDTWDIYETLKIKNFYK